MLSKKVVFISIFLVLLLNSASAQYYYDQGSSYGFYSGGGVDDILYIYEIYAGWIDFFIFLLLFLGLTQAILGESHLKSQAKSLSIGISLALSFALILWERNTGVNLLQLGPFALLLILLLIFFVVFKLLQKFGTEWWVAGAWAYVVFYGILSTLGPSIFQISWFNENFFAIANLLFWACILIGIYGLFASSRPAHPSGGRL